MTTQKITTAPRAIPVYLVNPDTETTIDSSNPLPTGGGGGGGGASAGDVAHDAVDSGNPVKIGGRANNFPNGTLNVTEGDRVDASFNRYGALRVQLADHQGYQVQLLQATGDGTSTPGTTNAVPAISANHVFNGVTWDRQRGDTNGTFSQGNVAHDAVDAGNPLKIGGKATMEVVHGGLPSTVALNDRANAMFDRYGRLIVRQRACSEVTTLASSAATQNATQGVGSAGNVLYKVIANNNAAYAVYLKIYWGTASSGTTPKMILEIPPNTKNYQVDFGSTGFGSSTTIGFALTLGGAGDWTAIAAGDITNLTLMLEN